MRAFKTYRDFINNPWFVVACSLGATVGYILDSVFYDSTANLRVLNLVCSGASFLTLLYFIFQRKHPYRVLKILAAILWANLFVAPFIMFDYADYSTFYLRNTLFYWALLPILALMFGTREYIVSCFIFFLQFTSITFLTKNAYLIESFITILVVLTIYSIIIYAFVISINHYFDSQLDAQNILKEQSEELRKSINTKGKLLSIIGHDLRSPLMSLTSLTVLIDDQMQESKNNELKELIGILNTTIDQTAFLVNNLLEWSRSQENRINLDLKPIRIEPFLNSLRDLHTFNLGNKNIDLTIGPLGAVEVYADQNTLQTILRNLITNSIKFTPENGKITVSTEQSRDGVLLIIKDTGIGMDAETVQKLNDIETYASKKGTNHEMGSGIGFNLCLELMHLHKGNIEIESTPGIGTTIKLFFPGIDSHSGESIESIASQ